MTRLKTCRSNESSLSYEILALSRYRNLEITFTDRKSNTVVAQMVWKRRDERDDGSHVQYNLYGPLSILLKIRSSRCHRPGKRRERERKRRRQTFIHSTFFLAQLNARHTGTRDPLRVATYLSTHTHTHTHDTHARTHARSAPSRRYTRG